MTKEEIVSLVAVGVLAVITFTVTILLGVYELKKSKKEKHKDKKE